MNKRPEKLAAIVLCGGKSKRMQRDKATLRFGEQTMLQRIVGTLQKVIDTTYVVAHQDQRIPATSATVLYDLNPERGPLEGLRTALSNLSGSVDIAFVCGVDYPLLKPEFVELLVAQLGDSQVAVPRHDDRYHPLIAAYRTNVLGIIDEQIANVDFSMHGLLDRIQLQPVNSELIATVDPDFDSLLNINTLDDYHRAMRRLY